MTSPVDVPGCCRVLVADGAVVVIGPGVVDGLVGQLSVALRDREPLAAVVAVLAANLRALPVVAAAFAEEAGQRLLLRGSGVEAVGLGSAGALLASGDRSTWAEHLVSHEVELRVTAAGVTAVVSVLSPAAAGAAPPSARAHSRSARRPEAVVGRGLGRAADLLNNPVAGAAVDLEAVFEAVPHQSARSDETIDSGELWAESWAPDEAEPAAVADDPVDGAAAPPDDSPASEERSFDFAHLLGETHYRDVEAAAVRDNDEEPVHGPAPGAPSPPPATPALATPVSPPRLAPPVPTPTDQGPGLIEFVPGMRSGSDVPGAFIGAGGDHDGHTVGLAALRQMAGPVAASPEPVAPASGPQVHAVRCQAGHANAPTVSACRRCGVAIADRTVHLLPRPSMGRLRFSDGMVVEIDRNLYVGRNPRRAMEVSGDAGVVTLPDPDRSLSRLHLEVRLEEWHVYVVDRRSSNGTLVQMPDHDPVQLRPEDPFLVVPGTTVELGGSTSFVYEQEPLGEPQAR